MTDHHEHRWLWHQPPDASLAPMVGICQDCRAIDFDYIAEWNADRMLTVTVFARAERDEAKVELAAVRAQNRDREQHAEAEVESLRATVRGLTSQTQAYVDRAEAEGARIIELAAEVDRLRELVAQALTHCPFNSESCRDDVDRIRREAGLT